MTHQTNFNSLSGSREILDLREKKKNWNQYEFFLSRNDLLTRISRAID